KIKKIWLRDTGVIASPFAQIKVDGPRIRAYLNVFAAKVGMALYRQHVGHPLPLTGAVHTNWFLNAGLAQSTADGILRILPLRQTLRQGAFQVPEQFAYRYNCDGRSILAALVGFIRICMSSQLLPRHRNFLRCPSRFHILITCIQASLPSA